MASVLVNEVGRARQRTRWAKARGKGKGKGGMNIVAPGVRVEGPESQQIKSALVPLLDQVGSGDPGRRGSSRTIGRGRVVEEARSAGGGGPGPGHWQGVERMGTAAQGSHRGDDRGRSSPEGEFPAADFPGPEVCNWSGQGYRRRPFHRKQGPLVPIQRREPYGDSPQRAIDNIWMGTDMSYFQTTTVKDARNKDRTVTQDEALTTWLEYLDVKRLADGDYDACRSESVGQGT